MAYAAKQMMVKTLTDSESDALLKVTGEHRDGFRDHVLFAMALGTGLRQHELLALNCGNVFRADGTVRRHVQLDVFKRSNDNADAQRIVIPAPLARRLEKLRALNKRDGHSVAASAPLFVSARGTRLSARMARHSFQVWQERAGLDRRHKFHSLRHTACSRLYEQTKDIALVQRFARHASVTTTMIYTHVGDEAFAAAVDRLAS